MLHLFSLNKNLIDNSYLTNELVSRNHREQLDLHLF